MTIEFEDFKKRREEGMSIRDIAEKTGTPKSTVHDILKKVSEVR